MKTKYIIFPVLLTGLSIGLGACRDRNKAQSSSSEDSTAITEIAIPDTALYGKLGEGTGMSCIEIITDQGDTLTLNKTDENTGISGRILGGTEHYNDRLTITANAQQESIITLVNLSTLANSWKTHPDSIKIKIETNGKVSGAWNGKDYDQWSMCNAKLVLKNKKDKAMAADTFEIQDLNRDSLILQGKNIVYKFYSK